MSFNSKNNGIQCNIKNENSKPVAIKKQFFFKKKLIIEPASRFPDCYLPCFISRTASTTAFA